MTDSGKYDDVTAHVAGVVAYFGGEFFSIFRPKDWQSGWLRGSTSGLPLSRQRVWDLKGCHGQCQATLLSGAGRGPMSWPRVNGWPLLHAR